MNNISDVKNCYGCGVCATVCAKKIIEISHNGDGFYEPKIVDSAMCTQCGLCAEVCSYMHEEIASKPLDIKAYAAWSKAAPIRHKCSSGGVGFEIGRKLIEHGYKVCTVRYNAEKDIAEHYIATTLEDLIPSMGSKYIQSYTVDAFKNINRKEKYLVIGTPCQIDSFRRYIRKFRVEDNFVLVDFFCHGVPSYIAWKAYSGEVAKNVGPISNVVWRHKDGGWHDSWAMSIDVKGVPSQTVEKNEAYGLSIEETKGRHFSKMSQGDEFYSLFLGNNCLGKACYNHCKYKYMSSSADIRLGDLWGTKYKDDQKGVSSVITFTPKGEEIINSIEDIEKIEHTIGVVAEGQMEHKIKYPHLVRPIIITMAKCGAPVKVLSFVSRAANKLKRMLKL